MFVASATKFDFKIRIWDVKTGGLIRTLEGHSTEIS